MLPAAHRMTRSTQFRAAVRAGRRARRGCLVVHLCAAGAGAGSAGERSGAAPIVGFVVGKSVGGSVVRHRVTRRLRAAVLPHLADLPAGSATVVRALPEAADAPFDRLSLDLGAALGALTAPARR